MRGNIRKCAIILSVIVAAALLTLLTQSFTRRYHADQYSALEEYCSYTSQDNRYTISLRDSTELGLMDAVRLNVYLVDNESDKVVFIGRKRLDFYNDHIPHVFFSENTNAITVHFVNKDRTETLDVDISETSSIYQVNIPYMEKSACCIAESFVVLHIEN